MQKFYMKLKQGIRKQPFKGVSYNGLALKVVKNLENCLVPVLGNLKTGDLLICL